MWTLTKTQRDRCLVLKLGVWLYKFKQTWNYVFLHSNNITPDSTQKPHIGKPVWLGGRLDFPVNPYIRWYMVSPTVICQSCPYTSYHPWNENKASQPSNLSSWEHDIQVCYVVEFLKKLHVCILLCQKCLTLKNFMEACMHRFYWFIVFLPNSFCCVYFSSFTYLFIYRHEERGIERRQRGIKNKLTISKEDEIRKQHS